MKKTPTTRPNDTRQSPGRNGYRYRQQFGVIVVCEDEKAQERAYARLQRIGFKKLRVVTV